MRFIPSVPAITNYDYSFKNKSFVIIISVVLSFLTLVGFGAQSMQEEKDRCMHTGGHMDFVTKEIEDTSVSSDPYGPTRYGGSPYQMTQKDVEKTKEAASEKTEKGDTASDAASPDETPAKKTRMVQVLECVR